MDFFLINNRRFAQNNPQNILEGGIVSPELFFRHGGEYINSQFEAAAALKQREPDNIN